MKDKNSNVISTLQKSKTSKLNNSNSLVSAMEQQKLDSSLNLSNTQETQNRELSIAEFIEEFDLQEKFDLQNILQSDSLLSQQLTEEDEFNTIFEDDDFFESPEERRLKNKQQKQKELEKLPFKLVKKKKATYNSFSELAQELDMNPKPNKFEKQQLLEQLKLYYDITFHKNKKITISYLTQKEREKREKEKNKNRLGVGRIKSKKMTLKDYAKLTQEQIDYIHHLSIVNIEGQEYNLSSTLLLDANFPFIEKYFLVIAYENRELHSITDFMFKAFSRTRLIDTLNYHIEEFYNPENRFYLEHDFGLNYYKNKLIKFTDDQFKKLERHGYLTILREYVLEDNSTIDIKNLEIEKDLKEIYQSFNIRTYQQIDKLGPVKQKEIREQIDFYMKQKFGYTIVGTKYSILLRDKRKKQIELIYNEYKDYRTRQEILVLLCELLRAKYYFELEKIYLPCKFADEKEQLGKIPPRFRDFYDNYDSIKQFINKFIVYCNAENKDKGIESMNSYTLTDLMINRKGIYSKLNDSNIDKSEILELLDDFDDENSTSGVFSLGELDYYIKNNALDKLYEELNRIETVLQDSFKK